MNTIEVLWIAVTAGGIIAFLTVLLTQRESGSAIFAAMLAGAFGAFTAVQIWQEGVIAFFINHTQNLTGLQVWWDLVMCVIIALFFIAPRARKAGMNVPFWFVLSGLTASIGLLAMCARLFWLEHQAAHETGEFAKA